MDELKPTNEWGFFREKIWIAARKLQDGNTAECGFLLGCLYTIAQTNELEGE